MKYEAILGGGGVQIKILNTVSQFLPNLGDYVKHFQEMQFPCFYFMTWWEEECLFRRMSRKVQEYFLVRSGLIMSSDMLETAWTPD